MPNHLNIFRQEFLNANSWAQRKDGVPLYLLDNLSAAELETAEKELISSANLGDTWQIVGLGHMRSEKALPKLHLLLDQSQKAMKVTIAHSIFQINGDQKMVDIVLSEVPQITNTYELIDLVYMLPDFKNSAVTELLSSFRSHSDYLVAYNATRALGLSTDDVVTKFRGKSKSKDVE